MSAPGATPGMQTCMCMYMHRSRASWCAWRMIAPGNPQMPQTLWAAVVIAGQHLITRSHTGETEDGAMGYDDAQVGSGANKSTEVKRCVPCLEVCAT